MCMQINIPPSPPLPPHAPMMQEVEFDVLSKVLEQLRKLLQDRALTLSSMPDLSPLCHLLCSLTEEKSPRLQKLRSAANPRAKLDPSAMVYPALTVLTTYPSHLDRSAQVNNSLSFYPRTSGIVLALLAKTSHV